MAAPLTTDNRGVETGPDSITTDAAGDVIFGENGNRDVRALRPADGRVVRLAGTGKLGFPEVGARAVASPLYLPYGVATTYKGDLLIADNGASTILAVDEHGVISRIAGDGAVGESGDGGPARTAKLSAPDGVAVDRAGDVFISTGHRVRKVDPAGIISTVAGSTGRGNSGDGGRATTAQLSEPTGLAVGPDGSLYIADIQANVVRKVDPRGLITTVAGDAQAGNRGDGGPATRAELDQPAGLTRTRCPAVLCRPQPFFGSLGHGARVQFSIRRIDFGEFIRPRPRHTSTTGHRISGRRSRTPARA